MENIPTIRKGIFFYYKLHYLLTVIECREYNTYQLLLFYAATMETFKIIKTWACVDTTAVGRLGDSNQVRLQ